jgi:hypothetical protein
MKWIIRLCVGGPTYLCSTHIALLSRLGCGPRSWRAETQAKADLRASARVCCESQIAMRIGPMPCRVRSATQGRPNRAPNALARRRPRPGRGPDQGSPKLGEGLPPRLRTERWWPPVAISSNFRRDQQSCAPGIPLADPSRLSEVPQRFRTPAIFELQANTMAHVYLDAQIASRRRRLAQGIENGMEHRTQGCL